ncbi:hypothetical protein EI761_18665 [Salmonella enterica]|nr:hypothetical protein [Salmonella enterica]
MTRLIEIYSRLNAIDDLMKLMLQPPNTYREKTINAHIASLVAYVDHVNRVVWKLQGFRAHLPQKSQIRYLSN